MTNLESFFRQQTKALADLDPSLPESKTQAERVAALVRDRVLKHIMIRRTRKEVSKYFRDDIIKNGFSFPDIQSPTPLVYEFDKDLDAAFNKTISLLKTLTYARYAPVLYQKSEISQIDALSQKNIKGFIKSLLVKRLESSFHAFRLTVKRIAKSYESFIEAFNRGKVYVGNKIDIGDILASDDIEELEETISRKGVEIYDTQDFDPSLLTDLQNDLSILDDITAIWANITIDPKFDALLIALQTNAELKDERILIFTESRETAEYIYECIQKVMPGLAMMFSSQSGRYNGQPKSPNEARALIRQNFDPACPPPSDDCRILITTDVLAEGMNLHRAGRIINYDLPWNPTRVMQRLGRINRIGTEHGKLCIFNFFPTAQADSHLGLQNNITKKITAFNSVLGNDNKILFEDENPDPHGLFRKLSSLGDEEDENSELEYLQEIREIRDNNSTLFEKIKRLPVKARSAFVNPVCPDELLIFFREGFLKKFIACGKRVRELTFLEAAPLMRAGPGANRAMLPSDYYTRLKSAKDFLDGERAEATHTPSGGQNRKLLETVSFLQNLQTITEEEQEYLTLLYKAISQSAIAKKSIKHLSDICRKPHATPLILFNALRAAVPPKELVALQSAELEKPRSHRTPKQIVLCQYLAPINEEL